jgi:hypothetical protein
MNGLLHVEAMVFDEVLHERCAILAAQGGLLNYLGERGRLQTRR